VRYVYAVRLTDDDVGKRVVIRWRRPAPGGAEIADILGILEAADTGSFMVRDAGGRLVIVPRERVLAGKTVPAAPRRTRPRDPGRFGGQTRDG
jgi:N-acetylglutamate synthase